MLWISIFLFCKSNEVFEKIPPMSWDKIACEPNKDSGSNAHLQSVQSDQSLRCLPEDACDPWLPTEGTAKTYQTVWMHKLV